MALKLQTGVENLTAPDKKGGKFTNNFYWKDGDRRFLAFTTPAAEIAKVLWHGFVKVPSGNDEYPFWNKQYFCRKDSAWLDESDGKCYVCDTLDLEPAVRFAAIAVELEPEFDDKRVVGLSVKYDEGKDNKKYPRAGLVVQSKKLFFSYLGAYNETRSDITTVSFDILRQGSDGENTKYMFFDIQDRPDLSPIADSIPDISDALENLGNEEVYAELEASGARDVDQQRFGDAAAKFKAKKAAGGPTGSGSTPKNEDPKVEEDFEALSRELGLTPAA